MLKDRPATAPEVRALLPDPAASGKAAKKEGVYELPVYKAGNGEVSKMRSDWRLTTAERKRILLNNIHGVDIDKQAVEVTKLSLLLKVLEEESEENVSRQLKLFAERALPSLHRNIRCGNSLVAPDYFHLQAGAPVQHGGAQARECVRLAAGVPGDNEGAVGLMW